MTDITLCANAVSIPDSASSPGAWHASEPMPTAPENSATSARAMNGRTAAGSNVRRPNRTGRRHSIGPAGGVHDRPPYPLQRRHAHQGRPRVSSRPPRTPRDLTHVVREIEQRLPPKPRKPSLPQVSLQGVAKQRRASVTTGVPSRARSRRCSSDAMRGAAHFIAHQGSQLPHQIGSNNLLRVVTLGLQGPEDLFGGPTPARSGKFEGSFNGGLVRGRHGSFLRQSPDPLTTTLALEIGSRERC